MRKRCDNEGKFTRPRAEESSGILKNNNQITQLSLSYFLSYSYFIKKNLGVTHSYTGFPIRKDLKNKRIGNLRPFMICLFLFMMGNTSKVGNSF